MFAINFMHLETAHFPSIANRLIRKNHALNHFIGEKSPISISTSNSSWSDLGNFLLMTLPRAEEATTSLVHYW